MKRRLFTIVSALSLLRFVAVLRVRNYCAIRPPEAGEKFDAAKATPS